MTFQEIISRSPSPTLRKWRVCLGLSSCPVICTIFLDSTYMCSYIFVFLFLIWFTLCDTIYDPTIPLLGIYPEKTIIQKDTCTPVFITALFTIARTWKQPRCPLTDEWITKLWYIYVLEYGIYLSLSDSLHSV